MIYERRKNSKEPAKAQFSSQFERPETWKKEKKRKDKKKKKKKKKKERKKQIGKRKAKENRLPDSSISSIPPYVYTAVLFDISITQHYPMQMELNRKPQTQKKNKGNTLQTPRHMIHALLPPGKVRKCLAVMYIQMEFKYATDSPNVSNHEN